MSLKDLTKDQHRNAETQAFVKILFSGSIDPKLYATYLYNQRPMYDMLEVCATFHGLFNDIPELPRSKAIYEDFLELWNDSEKSPYMCPVTEEYTRYILSIRNDPQKLLAHLYVRHMGDLSGGQMIAKKIPGSGRYYQFAGDIEDLKNRVRQKLNDDLADEAKVCFEYATRFFKEMMDFVNAKQQ